MIDNSTFLVLLVLGVMLMSESNRNMIMSKVQENKKIVVLIVVLAILMLK